MVAGAEDYANLDSRQPPEPQLFFNLFPEDKPRPANIIPNDRLRTIATNKAAYVVMADGTLRVGRNNAEQGHIDLAQGEPVRAAGTVQVVYGRIKSLDNDSGHYRPSGPHARDAAEAAFSRIGFDARGIYKETK